MNLQRGGERWRSGKLVEVGKSNARIAVEELRRLIFSGELAAGSNHLETELAERLGMSRTPVREAALMLDAQGLVEVQPRKGIRVLALSADDMHEVYEILTELEGLAVWRAAGFRYSERELDTLSAAITAMDDALARGDRESWAAADEAFHAELVRLGRNSRVAEIVEKYNDQVRRARAVTLYMRPMPTASNDDHRAVRDAILARDGAKARALHTEHRSRSRTLLTSLLERNGLRRV